MESEKKVLRFNPGPITALNVEDALLDFQCEMNTCLYMLGSHVLSLA